MKKSQNIRTKSAFTPISNASKCQVADEQKGQNNWWLTNTWKWTKMKLKLQGIWKFPFQWTSDPYNIRFFFDKLHTHLIRFEPTTLNSFFFTLLVITCVPGGFWTMTSTLTLLLHWEEVSFQLELLTLHVALAREDVSFELELIDLRR